MYSPLHNFCFTLTMWFQQKTKARKKKILFIRPIQTRRTKEGTGLVVVETSICFDVARYRGIDKFSAGNNPVQNGALQASCIIRLRT
jgi:hypothetical protein